MQRRKLLKSALAVGAVSLLGGSGYWVMSGKDQSLLTIDQAFVDLQQLYLLNLKSEQGWNLSQLFNHLAQSIEYSMTGYPEHKSDAFKNTLGQAAFAAFAVRGKMIHDLLEPIPGAPLLQANNKLLAFNRLIVALNDFKVFQGELQPHFAYGHLTHEEYTLAHVMHINNHLEVFI